MSFGDMVSLPIWYIMVFPIFFFVSSFAVMLPLVFAFFRFIPMKVAALAAFLLGYYMLLMIMSVGVHLPLFDEMNDPISQLLNKVF